MLYASDPPNLDRLMVIGDRVLIQPRAQAEKTHSGLFLPPGVQEKEQIQQGYVMKVGPGYPLPSPTEDESWKPREDATCYLPLQVQVGDLAIFLQKAAYEVVYLKQTFWIVPQNAILMIERDEALFD
jgi:co-chaperonin GroES (HSP10)